MVFDPADSTFGTALRATARDASTPIEAEVAGLFDRWRNPLLGYVVALGLPMQEGQEIIQEVFLSLFRHLSEGKPRDNLRGWMFRVAHNLALKRRYSGLRAAEQTEPGLAEEVRDPAPDPEQLLVMKQRQERLLAVVGVLPETDRCCLYLRAEGLRYREIAETLGISLGSVAMSLGRSLERLKRVDGR